MVTTRINFAKEPPMQVQAPNVSNELRDPSNKVTYRVMAYRALSRQELLQSVGAYLRQSKRPKPGTMVTILTIIGCRD
jgi:hypothetical protein